MPQNIKEMYQNYHKNSCLITYFTVLFWSTHTCIHRKIFMDHTTRTIYLDNTGTSYNTKSALCDMSAL